MRNVPRRGTPHFRSARATLAALLSLPALAAGPPPPVVSPTQEWVLGENVLALFLQNRPETSDAALAARVDAIGRRLWEHTERPDMLHRTLVVSGDDPQAFAFLGGTVAVTEGLARTMDDDELAFSLAHEMAHVDLRHEVNRMTAAGVVDLAAGRSAAADAALSLGDRHAEMEADRFGALYAVRAGFPFSAAARSLQHFQEGGGPSSDAKHPDFGERMRALASFETELRRAIGAFDRGCAALKDARVSDAVEYFTLFVASFPRSAAGRVDLGAAYLARWRTERAMTDGLAEELPILPSPGVTVRGGFADLDGRNARTHFEAALRIDPDNAAARIGLAMVLTREGRGAEARAALRSIKDADPLRAEALLMLGNVEYLDGAWTAAAEAYRGALAARPEWSAARANLARAFEKAGREEDARAMWSQLRDDPVWGDEARRKVPADTALAPRRGGP